MFESLSDKLDYALKAIRGQNKLTDDNVNEALAEVRRALLDADVNFNVTKKFIDDVKEKSLGLEVKGNLLPGQLMIKLIHDELVTLMGASKSDLVMSSQAPTIIMVAGLQGSGKTTFCGKLANSLMKKGRQPLLVACDIYRPAAIDEEMRQEAADLKSLLKPHEILFVCDAMTGQDAVNTALAFHERLELTGVVLTKIDGDTRGGAALSIRAVVGKPIKFVGTGEKIDALEPFYPERIASRILGMGDIVTLVEKAQSQIDDKEAERLEEKLKKNQFTFEDFLDQMKIIKKMGSLRDLLGMIPGVDRALRDVQIDDKAFGRVEAIILSMTMDERGNPRVLNGSRRKRIAAGSGTSIQDVNRLIKQFEDMQKMMKNMTKGKMANMMGGRQQQASLGTRR